MTGLKNRRLDAKPMMDNKFRNLVHADRPPRVGTLLGTLVKCA